MRFANDATVERSWLMNTNAVSSRSCSDSSSLMIAAPTTVSSAEVTSSQRMTSGSAASARARLTRCFSPPESSCG